MALEFEIPVSNNKYIKYNSVSISSTENSKGIVVLYSCFSFCLLGFYFFLKILFIVIQSNPSFLRCFRSQDCASPEACGSHPVQPPRSGGPASRPNVPHAESQQPTAATSGGRKDQRSTLRGTWRPGAAPDLSRLPPGSAGPAAVSFLHLPAHLLPLSGPPQPPLPHSVWGHPQPLRVGGLPLSLAGRNRGPLSEENLVPASRNTVWPSLCACAGAGRPGQVHGE